MHHASLRLSGFLALLFLLHGHPPANAQPTGERLIVESSVESFHIAQALIADFNERNPSMEARFSVDRDLLGARGLGENRIYIGTHRAEHPENLTAIKLYLEIIAFVVNEKNPATDISITQIKSLLIKNEDAQPLTWSDLSEKHSGDIAIHGPLVVSEVARFMMRDLVKGIIGGYHEHERFSPIAEAVSKDQHAIGFLPIGYAKHENLKTLTISGSSPHNITPEHRENPAPEYPLMRTISFYIDKKIQPPDPETKTPAHHFVDYLTSRHAWAVITQYGLLPWNPSFAPEIK